MNGLHLLALAASGLTVYVLYTWGRRSRDAEVAAAPSATDESRRASETLVFVVVLWLLLELVVYLARHVRWER